jgi:hypothetical protein
MCITISVQSKADMSRSFWGLSTFARWEIYYYNHQVYVVYIAFLSWTGYNLSELQSMAVQSIRAVL